MYYMLLLISEKSFFKLRNVGTNWLDSISGGILEIIIRLL